MTTSDSTDNTNGLIEQMGDKINNLIATHIAIGAGNINPNKTLGPGLIYDATIEDYVSLFCALNLTLKQI